MATRFCGHFLVAIACVGGWTSILAEQPLSAAEQALFETNHLAAVQPPFELRYRFRRTGQLETPFDDTVDLKLFAQPDGHCCAVSAQFLHDERAVQQPRIDAAQGNPAILYFLERDILEMQRLTHGQANHFRQRIRLALAQDALVRSLRLPYKGRQIAVQEITISPFAQDPHRSRFDKFADKQYVFLLSPEVPAGLFGIRTRMAAASEQAPPLMVEEMMLEGAQYRIETETENGTGRS